MLLECEPQMLTYALTAGRSVAGDGIVSPKRPLMLEASELV